MHERPMVTVAEPVRFTRGFVAFLCVMVLPAVVALGVFLGAAAVADEVYAADQAAAASGKGAGSDQNDVAAWKRGLVGICPIH